MSTWEHIAFLIASLLFLPMQTGKCIRDRLHTGEQQGIAVGTNTSNRESWHCIAALFLDPREGLSVRYQEIRPTTATVSSASPQADTVCYEDKTPGKQELHQRGNRWRKREIHPSKSIMDSISTSSATHDIVSLFQLLNL